MSILGGSRPSQERVSDPSREMHGASVGFQRRFQGVSKDCRTFSETFQRLSGEFRVFMRFKFLGV